MNRLKYVLLLSPLLCAFTPIYQDYGDKENTRQEFKNVEQNVQDQSFVVFKTTPNLGDLKDGQIVIYSSGAIRLMFRNNQDLYSVNASCITIKR